MYRLLLIGTGGALGSILRYALGGWFQRSTSASFPTGTLVVNVSGCFVIGVLAVLLLEGRGGPGLVRPEYRDGIVIGILGGYTTFSSFGRETFAMINQGQWGYAALNVGLSNGLGLGAVWLGYRLAERWFGA
jgi:fluoride exporter